MSSINCSVGRGFELVSFRLFPYFRYLLPGVGSLT
jgi:hypothetical protein